MMIDDHISSVVSDKLSVLSTTHSSSRDYRAILCQCQCQFTAHYRTVHLNALDALNTA